MPPNHITPEGPSPSSTLSSARGRKGSPAGIITSSREGDEDLSTAARGAKYWGSRTVSRVHGQWVDLTGFAHPGGPVALGLGAGRDATVLFESHHPFASSASLRSILDARRVPADEQATLDALFPHACVSTKYDFDFRAAAAALGVAGDRRGAAEAEGTMSTSSSPPNTNTPPPSSTSSPSSSPSTPAVDAFEAEIKSIFRSHFEAEAARRGVSFREATKATPRRWAELVLLGLLFLVGGVLPLVGGWYPALVIAPTLGWVWMVNSWHDASHFALSTSWLTNSAWCYLAPWFSSPLIWGHQHIIGHHAYTNVPGADPDLYHAPKLWRFQSSLRWTPMHAQQAYLTPLLWALSVPTLLLLKPLQTLATGTYNRAVVLARLPLWRVVLHLLGRAFVFASLYVWPWFVFPVASEGLLKPLLFAVVPITVYSLWFMACSQVNHHTDETSEAWDANWYRHQVMTSHTVAPDSGLAFLLSGGLNLQIEHHLFPAVNQVHLRTLQPLVEAAAKKHGVPYTRSDTISEAFVKLWRHLALLAVRPATEAKKKAPAATSEAAGSPRRRDGGGDSVGEEKKAD